MMDFDTLTFADFLGTIFIWPFILICLVGIFKIFRLLVERPEEDKEDKTPEEVIHRHYHYSDKDKVFAPPRREPK
jgi:hypothetical protein